MTLEELEQERREARDQDTSAIMASPAGRRFVWRVLIEAGVFSETFVPGAPDVSAYRQGRRAQALDLQQDVMRVAPVNYSLMVAERTRDAQEHALRVAQRTTGENDSAPE